LDDCILIDGSRARITWRATGCHKIIIENVGILPGNMAGAEFTVSDTPSEICFIGVRKKICRHLTAFLTRVDLSIPSKVSTTLPDLSAINPGLVNFVLSNPTVKNAKYLSAPLGVKFEPISTKLDPFILEKYRKPKRRKKYG